MKLNRRNNDLNNLRTTLADEASCDMSDHVCCQETEVLKDCRYYIPKHTEIWDSKTPSVGTILAYRSYFLRNKTFLFFKIESWNFQHLFEEEFSETSQNFNWIRQRIEKMEIKIVWMSWMRWNFVRFHEILFQTVAETFNFLSWKTKKFYS